MIFPCLLFLLLLLPWVTAGIELYIPGQLRQSSNAIPCATECCDFWQHRINNGLTTVNQGFKHSVGAAVVQIY